MAYSALSVSTAAAAAAAAAATAPMTARTLTVVTWNVAAVNNNPFEYWMTMPSHPEYERLMSDVERFLEPPRKEDGDKEGDDDKDKDKDEGHSRQTFDRIDVPIHAVFTDAMYDRLERCMSEKEATPTSACLSVSDFESSSSCESERGDKDASSSSSSSSSSLLPEVRKMWTEQYRSRRIVSEFMRDPVIGSKRLVSMPDRVTNTIHAVVVGGGDAETTTKTTTVCRPTVINMYDGDLSSVDVWYEAWERFMFGTALTLPSSSSSSSSTSTSKDTKTLSPYEMLRPIRKSKYPDVTDDEERLSLPLQALCMAIFDAVLVHMMNAVSDSPETWQSLKRTIADALVRNKMDNTLRILERPIYAGAADVIALQEASLALLDRIATGEKQVGEEGTDDTDKAGMELGRLFHVIAPRNADPGRDQNSAILLRKDTFPLASLSGTDKEDDGRGGDGHVALQDITDDIETRLGADAPVTKGDLLAIRAVDRWGVPHVIASFHGDTNGLATVPVLNALAATLSNEEETKEKEGNNGGSGNGDGKADGIECDYSHGRPKSRLIFGLDANTYEHAKKGRQAHVSDFAAEYVRLGLTSCWGDVPPGNNYTTFNARTYLQPQLNKACKSHDKRIGGDINPKDFVLFRPDEFVPRHVWKDNTGEGMYVEDMAFPTLAFPSDHGIVAVVLEVKGAETRTETEMQMEMETETETEKSVGAAAEA